MDMKTKCAKTCIEMLEHFWLQWLGYLVLLDFVQHYPQLRKLTLSISIKLKDFRVKVGNILPVLPKNNPPQSRTEFSGMNDLLTYLSEDYGKKKS
ncbi:unnamed protein product [Leptidea sinapis]|uniref:Uncharacterized protein n=1 Tax=Leptidea sinapis TaxID=189913 RepID=A0A5E4R278_9NEOP|nr:unnamed protein product [Leptidea sinapis]